MSNPTQPDSATPENAANETPAAANDASSNQQHRAAEPAAMEPGAPIRPQAYVDPSIAAEAQLAVLEAENSDLKDKFIRAHAEMDNLRKRTEREKADTTKYAVSKFAGDMLAVADNLQRALAAFAEAGIEPDPQTKSLIDGIELTDGELKKVLDRHGVRKIDALGAIFDPNFHQAVMEEEKKDVAAGTVLRVFQEGYQIGDRVLRPTMVVVARGGFRPVKASGYASGPAGDDQSQKPEDEPATGNPDDRAGSSGDYST